MKLVFYGDEEETKWFKKRFACPNGVPCPRNWELGVRIANNYPCKGCAFNTDNNLEHTNVTYNPPKSDDSDVLKGLQDYIVTVKQCNTCMFFKNGNCFFDYNCPADFER